MGVVSQLGSGGGSGGVGRLGYVGYSSLTPSIGV